MVYDVTERDSFKAVEQWMEEVYKHAPEGVVKVLVGNKTDAIGKKMVSYEEGKQMGIKYGADFLEASAKHAKGVDDTFRILAKGIKAKVMHHKKQPVSTTTSKS